MRTRFGGAAAIAAGIGILLGGCESTRFGGRGTTVAARPAVPESQTDPIVSTVPSGSVQSEPLAPPPGATGSNPDVPTMPGSPQPIQTVGAPPPAPPSGGMSRSAAIGAWTAREATGTSCKVNLSSTPSLDLYRASAAGCQNKDLARVTAWDYRDGEVYLYAPGGAVAARLRPGSGGLAGVLAKSGAPLTLTRA